MLLQTPAKRSHEQDLKLPASFLPAGKRSSHAVTGAKQRFIKFLIWINILSIALIRSKNILRALHSVKKLKAVRDQYRNQHAAVKYFRSGSRYFVNYNMPAWPSKAFNRYVGHLLNRIFNQSHSLNTLVFAITKKCGFQCEHCCEWEVLNKPEVLSKESLVTIIQRFHQLGVSQIQLSGGEPLNRFNDILYLLDHSRRDIDFWLYTSGYQLTEQKATQLKKHGLRGITISLDDHREEMHDKFRGVKGSFRRALRAAFIANKAGLVVCFSLCATRPFISPQNLLSYATLAKNAGASFIQVLEPKAVGRYAGHEVLLEESHQKILEEFFETVNYTKTYASYPVITYHGFYSRRVGCSGSGKDYVYVDTDGYVHNCPFCQRKLFHVLDDSFNALLQQMKMNGCSVYNNCSSLK